MNDSERPLLSEHELEEALADLRPDAGEFARGIADRISDRISDGITERGDDEPVARAGWPKWLKRAASVLPPGVSELALFGKSASAKAGSSFLLGPAAVITLGLAAVIAAFGSTRRLDASATGTLRDRIPAAMVGIVVAWGVAFALILFAIWTRDPLTKAWILGGLLIMAILVSTLTLSAARVADRERVGTTLQQILMQAGPFVLVVVDHQAPTLAAAFAAPLLAAAVIPIGLLQRGKSRAMMLRAGVFMTLVLGAASVLTNSVYGSPFGTSERELIAHANRVDAPASDLSAWESLGRVARSVDASALDGLDRDHLRALVDRAVEAGEHVHPRVASAAFRLGVLPPEAWDDQTRWLHPHTRELMYSDRLRVGAGGSMRFDVGVLKREGRWNDEARATLGRLIEQSWPEPGSFQCVAVAAACIESADDIGDAELAARLGERVPAVLASAWVGRRAPGTFAVGFESCLNPPRSAESSSSTDTTFEAVLLMSRFGTPESIDLERLDRYLTRQMRSNDHEAPHPYCVEAAVARLVLRRDVGVPRPTLSERLAREWMLVLSLFAAALAVWSTWRAPARGRR